jgi:Domain of unknown function (DUF4349)
MTGAELIHELQAARPQAGEPLRARVAAMAAQAPPTRRLFNGGFGIPLRRAALCALPAMVALALASAGAIGLARSGGGDHVALAPPSAAADAFRATTPEAARGSAAPAQGDRSGLKGAAPAVGPTTGRPQRYSGELTLEVANADALSGATQDALSIVRSLGGYAVSTSFGASGESGAATLVVRLPTGKVQEALVRLSQLGTIVEQHVQIDDLGDQVGELGRRESALEERVARLTARLESRTLDAETRAVLEARRAAARTELAEVRKAQATLDREASLATISLALRTAEDAAVPASPSRLDRALDRTGDVLAWEGIALLYVAVIAGPFVLLAAVAWAGTRVRRRREDERLLAAS